MRLLPPSFGMAVIGRMLEAQGFRVGIIAQPDWHSKDPFMALGAPNLFFGVAAGNMDSMINRYTADRKTRSDDVYTPGGMAGKRPDRATLVYTHRCREAYPDVPIIIGGIEASLRRIAHYDYWQETVRKSILLDAAADLLLYGNAERAVVEVAHRIASGEPVSSITDVRGTAFIRRDTPQGWMEIDSSRIDQPGKIDRIINPYLNTTEMSECEVEKRNVQWFEYEDPRSKRPDEHKLIFHPRARLDRDTTVIRLPSYEKVSKDKALYAHANRVLHLETNPGNARALVQKHGSIDVWLNPPPIPLTTPEMDFVFGLPYARLPHPSYNGVKIPAYDMIRFSVNIMRGCFGGCTFCSITEHEGRIIQSRSKESIIREVEEIRDKVPGFTGVISDLGGPTANMYRLACKDPKIEAACRKPACVYPDVCHNLNTDHAALKELYREARTLPGIKKILIGSGVRYDLAIKDPEYVKELVTHHVGGYLKIAPEHTESGPLSKMMKPGIGAYDEFKRLFEKYTKEAGKEQYLIPYFIAAHPGTSDEDMLNLALWLKKNGFRADQVQAFYPSPMASATTMYHTDKNPLHKVTYKSEKVATAKSPEQRKLHKAFLRWHDPKNWPLLRKAMAEMGRQELIGDGENQLIPHYKAGEEQLVYEAHRRKNKGGEHQKRVGKPVAAATAGKPNYGKPVQSAAAGKPNTGKPAQAVTSKPNAGKPQGGKMLTQHTGLPPKPRADFGGKPKSTGKPKQRSGR
ncbi:MAG: YgiQ family radical SAM protein [Candidatus Thiothrix putei]|uniref:YgiQ family radical SAM protein n=1 Tax=Candidatus Thiothrix putei TaxID=3080811 RepID=A0AA95KJ26_9GAMM|nr:MAG: YgiQ family radical SAM protein [Candidatus Thiothrix putei]